MIDFIIDWETIGPAPDGKVIELSAIPFDSDKKYEFNKLVALGRKFKFDLRAQPNRIKTASTIEWWKKQSAEARKILVPSPDDLKLDDGIKQFLQFLKDSGVDAWKSFGYCRGQSFDFPILVSILREVFETEDTFTVEPCKFWNQRDVRTAIENMTMTRGQTTVHLPAHTLDGFIKHNSIHDCAKDILMLQFAKDYAFDNIPYPSIEDADPLSVEQIR